MQVSLKFPWIMGIGRFFLWVLVAIGLLIPYSFSYDIPSVKISADVVGDVAYMNYVIELSGLEGGDETFVSVPIGSSAIYVRDENSDLPYEIKETKLYFNFTIPIEQDNKRTVLLQIKTKSLITEKYGHSEYVFDFRQTPKVARLEHNLELSGVPREDVIQIEPRTRVFKTEDGVIIKWDIEDPKVGNVFLVRFRGTRSKILAFVVGALVLGGLFVLFWFYGRKYLLRKLMQFRSLKRIELLSENEKSVLKEVIKAEGMTQTQIGAAVGLKKSNLSKITKRLEMRGLLVKKKIGLVTKLYPGEKIEKF